MDIKTFCQGLYTGASWTAIILSLIYFAALRPANHRQFDPGTPEAQQIYMRNIQDPQLGVNDRVEAIVHVPEVYAAISALIRMQIKYHQGDATYLNKLSKYNINVNEIKTMVSPEVIRTYIERSQFPRP
jgi:hypothetical protein